jgi:hypothetical protein
MNSTIEAYINRQVKSSNDKEEIAEWEELKEELQIKESGQVHQEMLTLLYQVPDLYEPKKQVYTHYLTSVIEWDGKLPERKHYTLQELNALPTLDQAHFDNLKVEEGNTRVWLSRMEKQDGAPYDNQVTVEIAIKGKWYTIEQYKAR